MNIESAICPYLAPAIRIEQPLGEFFVAAIPARVLLATAFTNYFRIPKRDPQIEAYPAIGLQRAKSDHRLRELERYIQSVDAAFPNSIILAANEASSGQPPIQESEQWSIVTTGNEGLALRIPTLREAASIIDGQHRLEGFRNVPEDQKGMALLCAVYFDLPVAYQAYVFATINFNQKKVDRSLAYDLFGYAIENEPPNAWTPDVLAVYITRRLNMDPESPLHRRIIVAAKDSDALFSTPLGKGEWRVSTATVVDGVLRLVSAHPSLDRDRMRTAPIAKRSRQMLSVDSAPFRKAFLEGNDILVYLATVNFLNALQHIVWVDQPRESFLFKTVGIQASFELLAELIPLCLANSDFRYDLFARILEGVGTCDFSQPFFQQSSSVGRIRILQCLRYLVGLVDINGLPERDNELYRGALKSSRQSTFQIRESNPNQGSSRA
ncbi:MAG TPA: DGQHR domain-containing protein [Armatimonadota bacterium]|jgi:DNA phosphorothioation-associated DGQHR protein 1